MLQRREMASLLGIPVDTLGTYERGVSEPGINLLAIYRSRFGINLNWLATGEGEMLERAAPAVEPGQSAAIARIAASVSAVYRQLGIADDTRSAAGHTVDIYNQLIARGVDPNDEEAIVAHLPAHELALRRKLSGTSADGGA